MAKNLHFWRFWGNELWRQKRIVNLGSPGQPRTDIASGEESEAKKEEIKDLGQERIEKFLGIGGKGADTKIDDIGQKAEKIIEESLKNWNWHQSTRTLWDSPLKRVFGSWYDEKNKELLQDEIRKIAEKEARKVSEGVFKEDVRINLHAKNSVHILAHELEVTNRLISGLDKEIAQADEEKAIIEKSLSGIDWLLHKGMHQSFMGLRLSSNLYSKIDRLAAMKKTMETIKGEKDAALNKKKEKKHAEIREWDENIRNAMMKYLPEDKIGEFNNAMVSLGLYKDPSPLEKLVKIAEKKGMPGQLTSAIKMNAVKLEKGNRMARWTFFEEGMAADHFGSISADEVRGYYLLKAVDLHKINQITDLKKKVDSLKEAPAGQNVKLGETIYILIRHDDAGYMLREKGTGLLAYINTQGEQPVCSLQAGQMTEEAGVKKVHCVKKELIAPMNENPSTFSINFNFLPDKSSEKPQTVIRGGVKKTTLQKLKDLKEIATRAGKEIFAK